MAGEPSHEGGTTQWEEFPIGGLDRLPDQLLNESLLFPSLKIEKRGDCLEAEQRPLFLFVLVHRCSPFVGVEITVEHPRRYGTVWWVSQNRLKGDLGGNRESI